MLEIVPIKTFCYPGGRRMCIDGLVRAAYTGCCILRGDILPDNIENMARKGQWAYDRKADTQKRNLIYLTVYLHAKRGDLLQYITPEGLFLLNSGEVSDVFGPRHRIALATLLHTGILHD